MSNIYDKLGLRTLINARGSHTRLGGSIMEPEVLEAMREASTAYVVLDELQDKASELIARATGAEAGMVTGGAAAALLEGTAACITGGDPIKIEQLPNTTGLKSEAIVHRAHRNGYDHSVRAAGVTMVEAGYGHSTIPYQFEAAFSERTAVVLYVESPWASRGALPLKQTCEIAHRHGVPVMVDAAAMLPPNTNLTRYISEGADLVIFSGGKGLHGPQSSGILAGRADLITAARANGSPNHSIGRPAKAAKEDIVGLMVAIQLYLERDHEAEMAHWRGQAEYMIERLESVPGVGLALLHDGREHLTPRVEITFDSASGINASEMIASLEQGDPRVFLFEPNGPSAKPNSVIIHCHTMQTGEEEIVAEVVRTSILKRLTARPNEAAVVP